MNNNKTKTHFEKFFNKYSYLPVKYANKVFDEHRISMEKSDLIQELNIRLIKGIRAYAKRWKEYRRTGEYKPVKLRIYLQLCMVNRVKDFIKSINKHKNIDYFEDFTFDYGVFNDVSLDFEQKNLTIRGVDILKGLEGRPKICFLLFLKGYPVIMLKKMFKNEKQLNVELVIKQQITYLQQHRSTLLSNNQIHFVNNQIESE